NDLINDLAKTQPFRAAWNLPDYTREESKSPTDELRGRAFWERMEDVEVIVRFFALRHRENYQRGMQGFLDLYSLRAQSFKSSDIEFLKELFLKVITCADQIYDENIFKIYDPEKQEWGSKPQKAFADAVM